MSAIVSTISKSIPTARPKIQIVSKIDFRIEELPSGKKAQLIREGHPTFTGKAEEVRARGRELEKENATWIVSCRGFPTTEHVSEEAAEEAAERIRKASAVTYTTKLLPASKGLVIVPKLLSLFGEALTALFMTGDGAVPELLKNPKIVASIVARLAERAAETNGLRVLQDLMVGVQADKVRIGEAEVPGSVEEHFDTHFAGRFGHMVEVALWVAQENFLEP